MGLYRLNPKLFICGYLNCPDLTDRSMKSRKLTYDWLDVMKSIAIPALTWFICMGVIWGNDIISKK